MWIRLKEIPSQVYIRYLLLTIPGTVVLILVLIIAQKWLPIPTWLSLTLILLWIVKEIILFPFVWRAYDHTRSEVNNSMIGTRGITKEKLAPTGYILVQGELWKAEKMFNEPAIEKNKWVQVKKIKGLKLFVVPEGKEVRGQMTENQIMDDR
ncbi:MAG: hypothetical protein KJP23_14630 [Deltaproteobacteria bacterium]|nr:hypothetical protein [Deltaproteobacteria bacterium]